MAPDHDSHFARQAQYLVKLECHWAVAAFGGLARSFFVAGAAFNSVMSECDFWAPAQHRGAKCSNISYKMRHRSIKWPRRTGV